MKYQFQTTGGLSLPLNPSRKRRLTEEESHVIFEKQPPAMLSIIVPTKNEAANVEPLLQRIAQASQGINLEVIFVDDSTDNTAQVVQTVSKQFPFDITVLERPPERRNGLG